jgi:hypothetical protein
MNNISVLKRLKMLLLKDAMAEEMSAYRLEIDRLHLQLKKKDHIIDTMHRYHNEKVFQLEQKIHALMNADIAQNQKLG